MAHQAILLSVADRAPAASGPPTLTEIEGFVAPTGFTLTETVNKPEELRFTVVPGKQAPELTERFLDLAAESTEIWAHDPHDGERLFAGPLAGYSPRLQGDDMTWEVRAFGLLDYLNRMRIEPTSATSGLFYSGVDQANIAKGLIDYYQALSHGHYGIDTSGVSATGVTRDRNYLAIENHLISQRISELAAVDNGFDFRIDPATRDFEVLFPSQGQDLSQSVIVDARSIADPSANITAGPEDLASVAFAIGEGGLISAEKVNTTLRAAIGRSTFITSFSGVIDQTTIDDHAQGLLDQRSSQWHEPARVLHQIGIDWREFGVGDLVEFAYDYGAGLMVEVRRIWTRQLTIGVGGDSTVQVGFA